jgi:hypothetical protein
METIVRNRRLESYFIQRKELEPGDKYFSTPPYRADEATENRQIHANDQSTIVIANVLAISADIISFRDDVEQMIWLFNQDEQLCHALWKILS